MRKQVLVSVDRAETRVALLEAQGSPASAQDAKPARRRRTAATRPGEGYRIAELYLERRGARSIVGNIYKGKVDNVLPGLEAAFVDIGLEKNGFLHVDEIVLPGVDAPKRGRGSGRRISDLLRPGQEIVVQVIKDPLKTKGARLSMELTIAGRYMVYAPTGEGVGVSRRLEDAERDRLRRETAKLDLGGGGAIVRTAAHGAKRADFERELQYLHKLHEVLMRRVDETPAPAMVFQEADLSVRVVRDIFSAHFERAIVDDAKQYQRLVSFFTRTAPELVDRVELWEGPVPLFEAYDVEAAFDGVMSRRVDLPSGGYLMIDYAEALTVIDVNSGSFIGRGKGAALEDTITKTNLEAAEEVVNQLRLRDIGGIIVIDFIDMARARNRDAVMKTLRKSLDEDRTKTFTAEISKLGLIEMTRQNVTEGVREIMSRPCPTCDGEGVIRSEETIAIDFERRLRDIVAETPPEVQAFLVQINPRVTAQFTAHNARVLEAIEADTGRFFHFDGSEGLALDHFAIIFQGTRHEVEERALPFREGDEVLVSIVEPHMYDVDDAVAKIDGYIISIHNAAANVGEKRLVRIENVGRTAATARLLDEAGNVIRAPEPPARAKRARDRRKPAQPAPPAAAVAVSNSAGDATAVAAPERKARKGSRKRAEQDAAAAEQAREAAASSESSDSGAATGGAGEEVPAPKVSRRRAARRAAAAAAAEDGGAAVDGDGAGEPTAEEQPEEAAPAPRKRSRSRAARVEAALEEAPQPAAAVADEADDADAEPVAPKKPRARRSRAGASAAAKEVPAEADTDGELSAVEEEARAEALAHLAGELPSLEPGEEADDHLQSQPRRRGRRGGRRRSAARARGAAE